MSFYKGKRVLVTGGTGLIGRPLVELLVQQGAEVTVVSLDDPSRAPAQVHFQQVDLRELSHCMHVCRGQDYVFHLAGVKGSPKMAAEKPASFMVPTVMFSFNMMEAARRCGVKRYLFTSSIGVYEPAEVFHEDSVWQTFPSPHDRFAGWAKRICELQAQSYAIEHDWQSISIVRPANVYGPFDNFDPDNAMVIPALIQRALSGDGTLKVWGDGSPVRDFIYSADVARGMLLAVEKNIREPINLGSSHGVTIKDVAQTIVKYLPHKVTLEWGESQPQGDNRRVMDTTRASSYGFDVETSLEQGIQKTINWYLNNQSQWSNRYNAFTESMTSTA